MLPIGCFFTDPAFLFKSTSTYCVPDEPNQVYKFFKAFQLKPNRLCDSKILDTGCKVHTTQSPRSILLIFFLSFFCTHFSSWPQPKSRAEEILILISIQQAKASKDSSGLQPEIYSEMLKQPNFQKNSSILMKFRFQSFHIFMGKTNEKMIRVKK